MRTGIGGMNLAIIPAFGCTTACVGSLAKLTTIDTFGDLRDVSLYQFHVILKQNCLLSLREIVYVFIC